MIGVWQGECYETVAVDLNARDDAILGQFVEFLLSIDSSEYIIPALARILACVSEPVVVSLCFGRQVLSIDRE